MTTTLNFHVGSAPSAVLSSQWEEDGEDPTGIFTRAVGRNPISPTALLRDLLSLRYATDCGVQAAGAYVFVLELTPKPSGLALTVDYSCAPPLVLPGCALLEGAGGGPTCQPRDPTAWSIVPGPAPERPLGIGLGEQIVASFHRHCTDRMAAAQRILRAAATHDFLCTALERWALPALDFLAAGAHGDQARWAPHASLVRALLGVPGVVTDGDPPAPVLAIHALMVAASTVHDGPIPSSMIVWNQRGPFGVGPIELREGDSPVLEMMRTGPDARTCARTLERVLNAHPFLVNATRFAALPALSFLARQATRASDRAQFAERANVLASVIGEEKH